MRVDYVRIVLGIAVASLLCLTACEDETLGQTCGTENTVFPDEPITNEIPVLEVVRLERDSVCETFECLREGGLSPYCSRTCVLAKRGDSVRPCETTADCARNFYCVEGECRTDDCPDGFSCQEVEETGPLADQRFCVRQTCESNLDCGDLGNIECVVRGCLDVCFLEGDACATDADCASPLRCDSTTNLCSCAYHALTCERVETLPCSCPNSTTGELDCEDAELRCQPANAPESWPTGTVTRRGFCEQKP